MSTTSPDTRLRWVLIAALFSAAATGATAQQPVLPTRPESAPLDQVIPVDPQITAGTLPNGLRYYVRANQEPQARAELRLVVKAGFDPRRRRPARARPLRRAHGVQRHEALPEAGHRRRSSSRSACASAPTSTRTPSFDETVYMLQVPTDKPGVARPGVADPRGLGAQRLVRSRRRSTRSAASSWRNGGCGAAPSARMQDKQLPVLLKGSRYAERLPIGKTGNHPELQARAAEAVLR